MNAAPSTRETLEYWFVDTSLGRLLVGESHTGVVWASLGKDDDVLMEAFQHHFPTAILEPGRLHKHWAEDVAGFVDNPRKPPRRPPLDLRGTDFQRSVWDALLRIPAGQTRSYGDVAKMIGRPRAVRAVGRACGANPVPYVVPCHRVIGSDGKLTGFSGGLPTKEALLKREGVR